MERTAPNTIMSVWWVKSLLLSLEGQCNVLLWWMINSTFSFRFQPTLRFTSWTGVSLLHPPRHDQTTALSALPLYILHFWTAISHHHHHFHLRAEEGPNRNKMALTYLILTGLEETEGRVILLSPGIGICIGNTVSNTARNILVWYCPPTCQKMVL